MKNHLVSELSVAAARGDVFGSMCPRKARTFEVGQRKLQTALFENANQGHVFAAVDGIKGRHHILALQHAGFEPHGLFPSDADEALLDVQPVLFELPDRKALEDALSEIWGKGIGIFVRGTARQAVVRQLQGLLFAEMPNGDIQFLRFYDPLVLEKLGIVLDEQQRAVFFGKSVSLICAEIDGGLDILCMKPETSRD